MNETDLRHLRRCVTLATAALEAGDEPFGSVLVGPDGRVLSEDRNQAVSGEPTRHPEFALARWAGQELDPATRAASTVYTSGEHCAMCSAAHAWVGLGRIVYACSGAQLAGWLDEWGITPGPVTVLAINDVAPGVPVADPADELLPELKALHARHHGIAL